MRRKVLRPKVLRPSHPVVLLLLVASVGVAFGALWEVAEWALGKVAPGDVIKDKQGTVIDMVMDSISAVVAGLLCHAFLQPPESGDQP